MLSREQAQKILEAARIEKPNQALATRVMMLPPALAEVTLNYLRLDRHGEPLQFGTEKDDWLTRRNLERTFCEAAEQAFYQLDQKDFDAVLETWLPALIDPVRLVLSDPQLKTAEARAVKANEWRDTANQYPKPLEWFAEHAAYGGWQFNSMIPLYIAAIDHGNDALLELLMSTAKNEHPVSAMGDHVIRTLLQVNRPEAWTLMEGLLLAAQRQEGLRQSIFSEIRNAHPEANRRMLHLMLEHDLLRFSSSVEWARDYLPLLPFEPTPKVLEQALRDYITRIENPQISRALLLDTDADPDLDALYFAHHTLQRLRTPDLPTLIEPWWSHPNPEKRLAAMCLLSPPRAKLLELLQDSDDGVAIYAFRCLSFSSLKTEQPELFAAGDQFYRRFQEERTIPAVASWIGQIWIKPEQIVDNLYRLVEQLNPRLILGYAPHISSYVQSNLINTLTDKWPWAEGVRELVVNALKGEEYTRDAAMGAIRKHKVELSDGEVQPLEKLLTRKTASTRQDLIQFVLTQPTSIAAASAARLSACKNPEQKKAGQEITRELELRLAERNRPTAVNGYGLFDPTKRTPAFGLERRHVVLVTPAALKCLDALEDLVRERGQSTIEVTAWDGTVNQVPLANYGLPAYQKSEISLFDQYQALPLHDVWDEWYHQRGAEMRDDDGLELWRAAMIRPWRYHAKKKVPLEEKSPEYQTFYNTYFQNLAMLEPTEDQNHVGNNVSQVLTWLRYVYPVATEHDFALDLLEDQLALMTPLMETRFKSFLRDGETRPNAEALKDDKAYEQFRYLGAVYIEAPTNLQPPSQAQQIRAWQLRHTAQQRVWWQTSRGSVNMSDLLVAVEAGVASETDLIDALIGPTHLIPDEPATSNHAFVRYMTRKPDLLLEAHPSLKPLLERCADRVLELELQRGDLSTDTTKAMSQVKHLEGLERLVAVLKAIGGDNIVRGAGSGYYYYYGSRQDIPRLELFSQLLRVIHPRASDTSAKFKAALKKAGISEQRLLELGLFAPQWVPFVTQAIGWKGLDEAMYWLLAHTKEGGWSNQAEDLEGWKAEMAQLTPLSTQDLMDGAVDVQWFHRAYQSLGAKHWAQLYECAKYTSSGTGHARAKQFAAAMLGQLNETEVTARVTDKRHQDSVRSLGLLPLPKAKDAVLLKRYEVIQAFLKSSKKFGSQRRASEGLAARIAMDNLARTAGYFDPMRLEWAMELKAVADLGKGPIKLKRGETIFILSVTPEGEPEFGISKNGKSLKDIPAAHKKDEAVLELRGRKKELEAQRSRMRVSLERAMVHGDAFTAKELRDLCKHPLVRPMLEQLVFVSDERMGFVSSDGKQLVSADGEAFELKGQALRLAHPVDFYQSKDWTNWQSVFFASGRQQPFKQIFRELYLPTEAERLEKTKSQRYAGHQVNPQQSVALLGSRGWVVPYEDDASRTFFAEGLTAHLSKRYGWTTPAEVEAPALDTVYFTKRNHWEALALEQIPPRVFSEVMRDLDLVVSVAHVGGVDPEASQSTTEMRAVLLQETLRLLKISNVRIDKQLAFIQGKIGRYSVHLGSAVVHQQPGWAVCLVAVPNQARGRIFLPFADSDPRTAEVIAKVLMLAKDDEIQDPILLRQLVG
jgi:hypothetical protein